MTAKLRDLHTFEEVEDLSTGRIGTLTDLDDVRREIADALGDDADDFGVDAIAADCYALAAYVDDDGTQHGRAFFVQIVDVCDFWESAERHSIR